MREMLKKTQFRVSSRRGLYESTSCKDEIQLHAADHAQEYELRGDIKLGFTQIAFSV